MVQGQARSHAADRLGLGWARASRWRRAMARTAGAWAGHGPQVGAGPWREPPGAWAGHELGTGWAAASACPRQGPGLYTVSSRRAWSRRPPGPIRGCRRSGGA